MNYNNIFTYLKSLEEAKDKEALKKVKQQLIDLHNRKTQEVKECKSNTAKNFTPKKVKAYLDRFVIGQEKAKKVLAVAAYKHMLRYDASVNKEEFAPQKNNVILIGGTGTGKTFLCQVLSQMLDLPFGVADLSQVTQTGFRGSSVSNITDNIKITKATESPLKRKHSIILLDEIDKIAETTGEEADVSTTAVQYELLKILEGAPANSVIHTDNVLFIGAGSFDGRVIEGKEKISVTKSMGFSGSIDEKIETVPVNEQLVEYGLIPELVGRFQSGSTLETLDEDSLVTIMRKSETSILKNFVDLFEHEGIKLTFTQQALKEVAKVAIAKGTGARSLNSVLEQILADIQFDVLGSDDKSAIKISKETVRANLIK